MRRSIKTAEKRALARAEYRAAESNGFARDLKCGVLQRRECYLRRRAVSGVF
jgi:hypothetical protein